MMTFFSRFDRNPKKITYFTHFVRVTFPIWPFPKSQIFWHVTYTLHLLSSRQVFSDQCHTTWPRGSIFLLGSDPSSHRPWEEEKEGRVAECSEELDSIPVHAP